MQLVLFVQIQEANLHGGLFLFKVSVCEPNPCRNGGKCIQDGNDFDCDCPQGYKGRFCHVGKYYTLYYCLTEIITMLTKCCIFLRSR